MGLANWGGEHVSRNESEPDSASIGKRRWPVRPTWMKPDKTDREATGVCSDSDLPGWLGTARVDRLAEEPGRPCRVGANATNAPRKYITVARPGRESERPILAKKRGNARGAKGPYCKHDSVRGGENRLDENPTACRGSVRPAGRLTSSAMGGDAGHHITASRIGFARRSADLSSNPILPLLGKPECSPAPAAAPRHAPCASLQLWTDSNVPACVDAPL
jgi:hypothetical protein